MGNAFLQLFMRGTPQVLRAVQGFGAKAAPKAVRQAVDAATNPNTYRALASKAENVLGRGLPRQFSGPNFGNIPAQATGLLSDLAGMPAGLQRGVQSGMVNRAIQEMAGNAPKIARTASQYASGALKAPVIGDAVQAARQVATGISGPLVSPTGLGGVFARDPGLRREFLKQFGGSSEKAARALSGANTSQVGSLLRSLQPGGLTGLRGSVAIPAMGGAAWSLADPTPLIGASNWLGQQLDKTGLIYNPAQDPRVTSIEDRPVVFPGENQPNYSGATDRQSRFAQYAEMGQGYFGGVAPPAPVLPQPMSMGPQAGQVIPPAPQLPAGPGVVSNGAGVPALRQNVQERALSQEVLNAAQQYVAPTSVPLSSFYAGQQQLGRSMEQTGELQRQLKEMGGATGMSNQALMEWAQANPGLAYRELQKLKARSGQ